jgi:hypothetical protein
MIMSNPKPWKNPAQTLKTNKVAKSDGPRSLRLYAAIMILLTVGYLIAELSFNASLLDIAEQAASPGKLGRLWIFGRSITAVAVILLLFGPLLRKRLLGRLSGRDFAFRGLLVVAISFSVVFFGERVFIEYLVNGSEGAQRQSTYWMSLMEQSLVREEIDLDGVQFLSGDQSRPEDKAFLVLLPFWGSEKNVYQKGGKIMPYVARKAAEAQMGQFDQYYHEVYLNPLKKIRALYNDQYIPASNAYAKAINESGRVADQAWDKYLKWLKEEKGMDSPRKSLLASMHWLWGYDITRAVQNWGVPVPDDWNPSDRALFSRLVIQRVKEEAIHSFSVATDPTFGKNNTVKPGLSWAQFVKTPDIKQIWKKDLGVPDEVPLLANMTADRFHKTIYLLNVESLTKQILKKLNDPVKEYESGGQNENLGREAYRTVIVPPIALAFSMLGGLIHLARLLSYLLMLALPWKRFGTILAIGAFLFMLIAPMKTTNDITSSRLVTNLSAEATGPLHKLRSAGLVWIVKTQTVFYPANNSIRTHILSGYDSQS